MGRAGRRHGGSGGRGIGLRDRVTLAFGLLALGLSLLLSVLAWTVVTRTTMSQTEQTALTETTLDRADFAADVRAGSTDLTVALQAVPRTGTTVVMARVDDQWVSTAADLTGTNLPASLRRAVDSGQRVTQQVEIEGTPQLVVGVPLGTRHGSFYEILSLEDNRRASRSLLAGLSIAAVVTALLGLALGRFASRVALRPLLALDRVASEVAAGRLDARLEVGEDRDLQELAASFNHTVEDLQRHVASDARFAVDVSHELRTPLTTMLNSMQVIQNRREQLPQNVREPVDLLAEELDRFRTLVVDLLEISRHDAGDQLTLERVSVGDLVRHAADAAAGRPVTVVDPLAAGITAEVDKRRLERVIVNLVRNAETHGGGCRAVTVEPSPGGVRVLVDDAGPGVPEHRRERVFDRFARGGSRDGAGVGLGLAIVQRHVALHDGQVSIEDGPRGGARLVVDLPVS